MAASTADLAKLALVTGDLAEARGVRSDRASAVSGFSFSTVTRAEVAAITAIDSLRFIP